MLVFMQYKKVKNVCLRKETFAIFFSYCIF